jgi:hypothetical protein
MQPEAFLNSLAPAYEFIYNNESELEPLQYPLAFSRYRVPRFANELYSDNIGEYFTYSGSNSVIVTKEKEGRYKNLTLRAYSGDSFKFYFQVGSGIADSDSYFSGPLTTSGVYSTMTLYATQSGALANAITFSAPTNNSSVYTLPNIQNLSWVRLYHNSVDGTTPYRIYQFIPRTLIQVDDLEADVIDVVSLRVSGSIVVTADNLANGSITGAKIMAGTVSGVLITPGTITANEISAGTITANKLNVTQLDAVAANMGTLVVNSGITVGTEGYIWTGTGSAANPTAGLKIYTTSGVSRLTTFSGGIAQVDIGSDGKLYVGSGQTLKLDSTGITLKPSVSGVTLFQISTPPAISTYEIRPPVSNLIKYKPFYYQTDALNSTTFYDYTSDIYSFSVGANQTYLKDSSGGVVDNDVFDGIDAKIRVGWLASESGAAGYHKIHNSSLSITSKGDTNSSLLVGTPENKLQMDKNGLTISGYSVFGTGVTIQADNAIVTGTLTVDNDILTKGALLTTSGLSSNGSVFSLTTPRINYAENSGKPTLTITGSGTSGTSGGITLNNSNVATPGQKQGYINMDANDTLEITNEVTGGFIHLNIPNDGTLKVFANNPVNPQLFVDNTGAIVTGTLEVTGQTTLAALNASGAVGFGTSNNKVTIAAATGNTAIAGSLTAAGAIGFGTSNNKVTIAAATGNTAIAGTLGVTGAVTMNDNFLQFNYGGMFKNTAQTVNAGADARITFQVSYTNGDLDDLANHRLLLTYAGLYVITAGVVGNFVHTWRVVTGGNFDTGHLMNGQTIVDMRAYVTKQVYLNAGTELELWVRNTGGNNLAVTTGGNGTILTAVKVG